MYRTVQATRRRRRPYHIRSCNAILQCNITNVISHKHMYLPAFWFLLVSYQIICVELCVCLSYSKIRETRRMILGFLLCANERFSFVYCEEPLTEILRSGRRKDFFNFWPAHKAFKNFFSLKHKCGIIKTNVKIQMQNSRVRTPE